MLHPLDNRTLAVVILVVAVWLTLTMALHLFSRRRFPGLGHWILGNGLMALGTLLIYFQGALPHSVTIILSNLCLVGALGLILRGLRLFMEVPTRDYELATYLVLTLIAMIFFTYFRFSTPGRVAAVSILFAVIFFRWGQTLIRPQYGPLQFLHQAGAAIFFLLAVFFLGRAAITLAWPSLQSILNLDLLTSVTFTVSYLANITWTILFTGLIAGRIESEREKVIEDLQAALSEVRTLEGLIPICAHCKQIRDDKGYWQEVERYFTQRASASFTHSICPDCVKKFYPDLAEEVLAELENEKQD